MKNEAEFNTVITKSLTFGHKISDASNATNFFKARMPFDGFGAFLDKDGNGYPVYFESKYLNEPKAFNFNRLEDHQIDALLKCKRIIPNSLTLFLVGVNFGRGDIRVFVFRDMEYVNQRKINKESLLKKEFIERKNYVKIKKGLVDFNEIVNMPKELEYK